MNTVRLALVVPLLAAFGGPALADVPKPAVPVKKPAESREVPRAAAPRESREVPRTAAPRESREVPRVAAPRERPPATRATRVVFVDPGKPKTGEGGVRPGPADKGGVHPEQVSPN
ncbi:hypothetical protein [Prosthecomicrobium sp. N25]|uniref:hypothetical protein n=1 Tax=Prosthecomicrobium sp. N25 TaxID=3129254 RepID=UPI003076C98C